MSNYVLTVSGRKSYTGVLEIAPKPVQWYMQKEDREVIGSLRSCIPCPAVFVMKNDPHAAIGQQWQYATRASNYNMTLENAYLIFDSALAFANRTGFRHGSIRADYFHNKDLSAKPPQMDKVRTTSRSIMTGVEQFSPMQALKDTVHIIRTVISAPTSSLRYSWARSQFTRIMALSENVLNVKVFDSRQNPPLKPGYSYPGDISEVNPDAYAIMPETHPEM